MNISHGLMPGQVLQRDARGRGAATITGRSKNVGTVELRVQKNGATVRGHDWQASGEVEKRAFSVNLDDLRTGGPYRVELRIRAGRKVVDRLSVDDVFVGDVWILAGQSNMEGIGNLVHAPKPHPQVRAFFMRDEWGVAEEKLHYLSEAVDIVHNSYGDEPGRPPKEELEKGRANLVKGTSPGLAFALDMLRRTRIPQGLIPCAHGGTSMAQWSPKLRHLGGGSLYGAMMRRYEKLGQGIAGILWYQGESDASPDCAPAYTQNMINLVSATRRDMGLPKLPWAIVQLGCHAARENEASWNSVQEQQRRLPEVIRYLDVAPAIDLELDDGIHIGGKAQVRLGRRLARVADRLVHKTKGVKPGIILKKIEIVPTPHSNIGAPCRSVLITYVNVAGKLVSDGRAAGFALLNHRGEDICGIFKTTVRGSQVLLHTNQPRHMLEMLSVSYGHGRYPVCTITDREGMSIPGMQAVPIFSGDGPEWLSWQTSTLAGVTSVSRASLSKVAVGRGWKKAPPREGFGVLPKPAASNKVAVYALRSTLRASEDLDAQLFFGANAPFKIWVNGKLVLSDRNAAPPMIPDEHHIPARLVGGKNTVVVAFAPRGPGAHLGISVRVGDAAGVADPRITV